MIHKFNIACTKTEHADLLNVKNDYCLSSQCCSYKSSIIISVLTSNFQKQFGRSVFQSLINFLEANIWLSLVPSYLNLIKSTLQLDLTCIFIGQLKLSAG